MQHHFNMMLHFKMMHKSFLIIIFLIAATVQAVKGQSDQRLQFSMHYGFQQESLHWSIAGNSNGTSPNIYSELKWKHYNGFASGASLQWQVWKNWIIAGGFNRLQISSGKVDDTDYAQDNRTGATYAGHFDADKGYSSLYQASAGYVFTLVPSLKITPYLGYITSRQSLYILDNSGQLTNLNSTYHTDWKGPFIKADINYNLTTRIALNANINYSQVNYHAHADWNLIQTFQHPVSYRHYAKGYGLDAGLKLQYRIAPNLSVFAGGTCFNWQTGTGTDDLFLNNGNVDHTQLNGVFRNGFQVNSGTTFSF
ncbi:hypothetical protein GCM10027037_24730 [Mucilaginibacter koreensis]